MKTHAPEAELRERVIRAVPFLRRAPFCREAPALGRSIDFAFICRRHVVTVEFKMHNWRQAIAQARDHQLAADYAYICMPRKDRVSEAFRNELDENGIGLYEFCARAGLSRRVRARRSVDTWPVARAGLEEYIVTHAEGVAP